jgi:arginine N-succinyltransferase
VLILRPVETGDLDALLALAAQLDSMNLPSDRAFLEERIAASVNTFGGGIADWREGIYVFVLVDTEANRPVGTSTVFAKHGTPGAPHYWLEVCIEQRRSVELQKRFAHKKLMLKSSEDGPTEIGGLILDPAYRRHPLKCGKALSIVRLAYISMHRERFERDVIAEMQSPFAGPGQNLLWDAFGAHFTGLSFREADHLSARSKQFIADLFPCDPVYTTLFPKDVQEMIGRASDTAKAALRILEHVGFHDLNQVDPFDGGPYYGAATDAISSVNERRELVLPGLPPEEAPEPSGPLALLSAEAAPGFRATVVPLTEDGIPIAARPCRDALGVRSGDRVTVTPLP